MNKIDIKPLSVNRAWKGRRFKTEAYSKYREDMYLLLPKIDVPEPPIGLMVEFGVSNKGADIDNPLKPLLDSFKDKYGIDDKHIYQLLVKKTITKKGQEFINFDFYDIKNESL